MELLIEIYKSPFDMWYVLFEIAKSCDLKI
jgi:hypothetical protein